MFRVTIVTLNIGTVKVTRYTSMVIYHLAKGHNFVISYLLLWMTWPFQNLVDPARKGKSLLLWELTTIKKGGQNEKSKVASLNSVFIQLNIFTGLSLLVHNS